MNLRNGAESAFGPGQVIADRYEVVQHLGAGAMGTVLRAIDRTLDNEPVALKLLYPHLVTDATIFARFRNEVLLARRLAHPNIVRIYDFGRAAQGYYFISMEYVTGSSLKDRIYGTRYEPLRFDEILRILYDIGQGVAHAHKQGVIHRDLKPDNILISDRGEVKITDFGLARQAQADKGFTQSGETVGTPCYMAPEQIRGERVDCRADIYSLGIMAYELVTGEKPFDDDNWLTLASMHMKEPLPEFPKNLDIPEWFAEFVEKSAAKRPEDRFQTAEEWAEVLRSKVFGTHSQSYSPAVFSNFVATIQRKSRRGRARRKLLVRFGALFGFSLALVAGPPTIVRNVEVLQAPAMRFIRTIETGVGVKGDSLRRMYGLSVPPTAENLQRAVNTNSSAGVRLLLASGVAVSTTDSAGVPLPFVAARAGKAEIVREFLDAGFDPAQPGPDGRPLLFAAAEGDTTGAVVQMLLQRGLAASTLDKSGDSALSVAVRADNLAVAQHLLVAGAFTNVRDSRGSSPLLSAVRARSLQMVQALIDAGARLNDADSQGYTALMHAAKNADEPIVKLLLARGADPAVRAMDGKTAKDVARGEARVALNAVVLRQSPPTERATFSDGESAPKQIVNVVGETRLRLVSGPEGVWERGRALRLKSIQLTTKNVGDAPAQNVRVQVVVPGGRVFALSGAKTIAPNTAERFSLEIPDADQMVGGNGELRATVSCDNCRS